MSAPKETIEYGHTPWYSWLFWFFLTSLMGAGFIACVYGASFVPNDERGPFQFVAAMCGVAFVVLIHMAIKKPEQIEIPIVHPIEIPIARRFVNAGGIEFTLGKDCAFCETSFVDSNDKTVCVSVELYTEPDTPTEWQLCLVQSLPEHLPALMPKVLESAKELAGISGDVSLADSDEIYIGITKEGTEFDFVVAFNPSGELHLAHPDLDCREYVARIQDWEVVRTSIVDDGHPHTSYEYLSQADEQLSRIKRSRP